MGNTGGEAVRSMEEERHVQGPEAREQRRRMKKRISFAAGLLLGLAVTAILLGVMLALLTRSRIG